MKTVSRFEANLLRILQSFLQRAPLERALPLVMEPLERPPCLSRAAVELVQDHLRKGCVWLLARTGWRRERHLVGSQIKEGRLWERTGPQELGLTFSRNALDSLIWITAAKPDKEKNAWRPGPDQVTIGDRLLLYLAFAALHDTKAGKGLCRLDFFHKDGLCRLAFPDEFPDIQVEPDWDPWTSPVGSCILEALQLPLAERWFKLERGKEQISTWQRMRSLGQSQERVLIRFGEALTRAGRWDLARFLLRVLATLLGDQPNARRWLGNLDVRTLRLADRQEIYHAALALVRHLERLQEWQLQALTVGYFEEGYAASQLWKADWERFQGDELCRHAQGILHEIEPLKT
jgi:hypothetical protein